MPDPAAIEEAADLLARAERPLILVGGGAVGTRPALVGLAVGTGAAFFATTAIADLLFGVSPHDPVTFVALPILLGAVAVLASWIPSLRAVRVAPVEALRAD